MRAGADDCTANNCIWYDGKRRYGVRASYLQRTMAPMNDNVLVRVAVPVGSDGTTVNPGRQFVSGEQSAGKAGDAVEIDPTFPGRSKFG